VAQGERHAARRRPVGKRFLEPGRIDDLALKPRTIGFARNALDDRAEQRVAVVGVLEARVALERRGRLQVRGKLGRAQEGAAPGELPAVGPVAHYAAAVRKQLGKRHPPQRRMQPLDVPPDRVVQPQPAFLAQLHHGGRGKALRMRSDPEAVSGRKAHALRQVGVAEGRFQNDLALVGSGHRAARLFVVAQLELEPAREVVQRGVHPLRHR
jgi:hypothetical protein